MKALLISLFLFSGVYAQAQIKYESDYLKRQVSFWKQIYTVFSVDQTIIHDRFEPSIIYKVVDHKNYLHHARKKKVIQSLREVRRLLQNIQKKRFKNMTSKEKEIFAQIPLEHRHNFIKRVKGVKYQQGMKEKFQNGVGRSYLYLKHIEEILEEKGLPKELAYLPHVESSFNYKAYSKVGAAGIWQFMRGSGKQYGLKIGRYVDERLDPIKASKAAARMLKDNYRILKSWPLAVTAYNHGPYGLKKFINKIGTNDFEVVMNTYKNRSFSFASRNFYASFLAAVEVAQDYHSHFKKIEDQASLEFETLKIKKHTRVKTLMRKYSLDKKKFKFFNPHIKYKAINLNAVIPRGTLIRVPEKKQVAKQEEQARRFSAFRS